MAKVILGNHSSVLVPRQDRDSIRKCYCAVLGGKIMKADPERDFVRLAENFYMAFLYGDVTDESEFLLLFSFLSEHAVYPARTGELERGLLCS